PAHADIMPVGGGATGTFLNPTGGSTVSGNQWRYDGANGFVTFNGTTFSGFTSSSFNFGSIVLTNLSSQPTGTFTADLDVTLSFTIPAGQIVDFTDGLQIQAQSGGGESGHGDGLILNYAGFPSPKTFSVGGETYTISYDGFYNSASNKNTSVPSL